MNDVAIPSIAELGADLLVTTPRQRTLALVRPPIAVAVFAVLAWQGWWWLLPVAMFGVFVSVVTVTHDAVHRTLGLGPRGSDWVQFALGLVLLESGHAYRATHAQHHRLFPSDDDPEGYPANLTLLGAIAYGPVFLARLWVWALRRSSGAQRRWLIAEAAIAGSVIVAAIVLWPVAPGLGLYALGAVVGSWVYPLLTVYLPHHDYGDTPITQTSTLRGRIIPFMFLELTYHLEHHLYPQVPTHSLPELAARLDPVLRAAGVVPRRVI